MEQEIGEGRAGDQNGAFAPNLALRDSF